MLAWVCGICSFCIEFYVDEIAFHWNFFSQLSSFTSFFVVVLCSPIYRWRKKKMFPQDFVAWNQKLWFSFCAYKKEKSTCINTCFLQTNFDLLPQIFSRSCLLNHLRVFCVIFQYALGFPFTICMFIYCTYYTLFCSEPRWNSFGKTHFSEYTQKKMNVFNTWNIFDVCGIHFCNQKEKKYLYGAKKSKEKNWNTMLSDKRKIVLLNLFPNFFFRSSPSPPTSHTLFFPSLSSSLLYDVCNDRE